MKGSDRSSQWWGPLLLSAATAGSGRLRSSIPVVIDGNLAGGSPFGYFHVVFLVLTISSKQQIYRLHNNVL